MHTKAENSVRTLGWLVNTAGLACIAVIVVAYFWLVLEPLQLRSELCTQRAMQLEALVKTAPQVRNAHSQLQAELDALKLSVAETQRRLPAELGEHEFVEHVRQVAVRTGVEFSEYHMGAVAELQSYSRAEVTLLGKGSYASICSFLDEVDHFPRITEISSLEIESIENFHSYPLRVTFVLYFGGTTHDTSMRGEVL